MYYVDIINGNDENDDSYENTFQSLSRAIDVSKSGDTVILKPGTYDPVDISSTTKAFELKIKGSGNNTLCNEFSFFGYFDITFEDIILESIKIKSSSSNFYFKNVKFAGGYSIQIDSYEQILGDEPRNCFVFEGCRFEKNFQLELKSGNHIISIKSSEIKPGIPLILCKSVGIDVKLTNINFERPILFNKKSYVEIQHTGCNFNCPLFQGDDVIIYTKDSYQSPSIERQYNSPYERNMEKGNCISNIKVNNSSSSEIEDLVHDVDLNNLSSLTLGKITRQNSNLNSFSSQNIKSKPVLNTIPEDEKVMTQSEEEIRAKKFKDLLRTKNDYSKFDEYIRRIELERQKEKEEKELYGGIELDSSEFRLLHVHRFTEFIRIRGSNSVELVLPKDPINGHLIEIYTDTPVVIDGNEYYNKIIRIRWTINGGYFFYPYEVSHKVSLEN